jgi:hypothetical protein
MVKQKNIEWNEATMGKRLVISELHGKNAKEITNILKNHINSAKERVIINGVEFGSREYCTFIQVINHEPPNSTKIYDFSESNKQPDITLAILVGCPGESQVGVAQISSFTDINTIIVD